MSDRAICRHYEVFCEVLTCARCGDAFRCCPVCPGNRSLCLDCEHGGTGGHDYPLHGYLYTADGVHGPTVVLRTREELWTFLGTQGMVALLERRELRLTSGDEDDLYVHIQDGTVLHAGGADPGLFTQALLACILRDDAVSKEEG